MASMRLKSQDDLKNGKKNKAEITCEADTRQMAFTDVNVNLSGKAADQMNAALGVAKVAATTSGSWNEEQELALVKAMKQYGKDVEDRWLSVSEVVPGKTKAQCFLRFKELRETFRAEKGTK
eukprot:gene15528-21617_t